MACSPSGRLITFNLMVTPEPPFAGEMMAVPTLAPFASFICTVTGLSAAWRAAAIAKVATEDRICLVDMANSVSIVTILFSHAQIRNRRRVTRRMSGRHFGGATSRSAGFDGGDRSRAVAQAAGLRARRANED